MPSRYFGVISTQYLMENTFLWKLKELKSSIDSIPWDVRLPNAFEKQDYLGEVAPPSCESARFVLTEVTGVDEIQHGLKIEVDENKFSITGTPDLSALRKDGQPAPSEFTLTAKYRLEVDGASGGAYEGEKEFKLVIVPAIDTLWRDEPVNWDQMPEPRYQNENQMLEFAALDGEEKHIVAASLRGRSHAQDGKPRDDAFRFATAHGWQVLAVSDGAGSACYSREGARLACEKAVAVCCERLDNEPYRDGFEAHIKALSAIPDETNKRKPVGDSLYTLLCHAANQARQAIAQEAGLQGKETRTYAATLLLCVAKHFPFGWFVGSFWVGDGAIALYRRDTTPHTVYLMGEPDEGEYGGQTRFLTMPEVFSDASALYRRLRFQLVDDFSALFLMTDGVSDPKFETTNNLKNAEKWDALWDELTAADALTNTAESEQALLEWLGFPSPGNHDDRTLLVLCGNTLTESEPTDDASAATTASQDESEATPPTPELTTSAEPTVSALAPSAPAESVADVPVAVMDEPTSALTPSDTSSDILSYLPMGAESDPESTPNTPETTSELQQPEMEQLAGSSVVLNGKGSEAQQKAPKGKNHNKRNKRH
mgnify:CR=1 FL=1